MSRDDGDSDGSEEEREEEEEKEEEIIQESLNAQGDSRRKGSCGGVVYDLR